MSVSKREMIVNFMQSASVVRLYVDPRPADVIVPKALKQQDWVCLDIGLSSVLARPIPDLDVGNWGVYGTLSFGGCAFHCEIPYDAIHAARHMTSGVIVSWTLAATAQIRAEASATTSEPTPRVHEPAPQGAKVIDMAAWRRARGR